MNVQGAWAEGITGKDVVVTILDDGLEKDHPDLKKNYVSLIYERMSTLHGISLLISAYKSHVRCAHPFEK